MEAVQLVQTSQKPLAQIARDLGIADNTLHHWRQLLTEQAFPGSGHQTPQEEEMRQLKRGNELLRQERDVLKKARRASFRAASGEVPIQCRAQSQVLDQPALPGARCF